MLQPHTHDPHRTPPGFVTPLLLVMEFGLAGFLYLAASLVTPVATVDAPVAVASAVDEEAARRLELLTSTQWEDDYQGHRILELAADGTGSMTVHLSGAAAFLFARSMRFTETWRVEDDVLTMTATGGEPTGPVNVVLKTFGTQASYRIEQIDADHLVLIDLADQHRYEWRRVVAADTSADTSAKAVND